MITRSASELSAERLAELRDNGQQQALPLLSAGYREVLDLSRKFKPLCDEAHTTTDDSTVD